MYSCRFLLIFENQSGIDKHETKKNTFSRCRTGVNAECLGTKIQKILRGQTWYPGGTDDRSGSQ